MKLSGILFAAVLTCVSATSSFSVLSNSSPLTFQYSTDAPNDKNWIGLYETSGGGPDNQVKGSSNSLSWSYAPQSQGTVKVNVNSLPSGKYKAYFLAKDGYTWLANPQEVFVPGKGGVSFYTSNFTTINARQGDAFNADISGLVYNTPSSDVQFTKVDGSSSSWVKLSAGGILSGTPSTNQQTTLGVKLTGSDGSTATLQVIIPVKAAGSALVTTLRVMTANLWHAGNSVNNGRYKQIRDIVAANPDLVGLQETSGVQANFIAKTLGWYAYQTSDASIVSRYPIAEKYQELEAASSARIALDGNTTQVIFHNAHLGYTPYGPYDFCYDKRTPDEVLTNEAKSGRTRQIQEVVAQMQNRGDLTGADKVPVILTGDFNAPSQLDWTAANAKAHCDVGYFEWPTSKYPLEAGLKDSYREIHADPVQDPANTWSPIYLIDTDYNNQPEPMDRIDFIYYAGGLKPFLSTTLFTGNNKAEPNHQDNDWSSDHKWVITSFKILGK